MNRDFQAGRGGKRQSRSNPRRAIGYYRLLSPASDRAGRSDPLRRDVGVSQPKDERLNS